jgi:hypothetical protein
MRWTLAFLVLLVGGLIAVAVGSFASLPACEVRADGIQECSRTISDAAYSGYQMVQNVGFAVAAVGVFGLLGRYTGLLRR